MINEILNNAEDIVLIGPSENRDKYIFAVAPCWNFKKKCFDATLANPAEQELTAFQGHWSADETSKELKGSSTYLGLRLDKVLRKQGLWIPGLPETRALEAQGKLTNGVYRDLGAVVYSDSSPNREVAHSLITTSGRTLPIIFSFGDLDYKINTDASSGVELFVAEKPRRIISGEQAVEALKKFNYKANAGARRLYRHNDGYWSANYDDLVDSDDAGRVGDWLCGEAARAELKEAREALGERKCRVTIKRLEQERKEQMTAFTSELESK